jgi:hypothetical protein
MSAVVEGSDLHARADARPDAEGYLASLEWRTWVRGHPWAAAAIAGLVAGQMATIVGYFLNAIGLPQLNWPAVNGGLVLPGGEPGAQWFAGLFVHTVDSVVFAMLFVILVWRLIPFRNTSIGNVGRGIVYSLVLAIISAGVLVPYVYFQKVGLDPFSFGIPFPLPQPNSVAPDAALYTNIGWKLPFAILVWHLVYGFFLGALYDPSARKE